MNVDLSKELEPITKTLGEILLRLEELENRSVPEWCTLSEAAKLKNLSYETLKKNSQWGPDPAAAKLVCGKRRWHRETIQVWLRQDDTALDTSFQNLKAV